MRIKIIWSGKVSDISDRIKTFKSKQYPIVWFRGQEDRNWNALPKMYRGVQTAGINDSGTYGNLHLSEDYRFHSFRAKTGHQISTNPASVLEWSEIMQHHGISTRLLDWTESMVSGLLFALEPLFMNKNDIGVKAKRRTMRPALWALLPQKLNMRIFKLITTPDDQGRYSLIDRSLEALVPEDRERMWLSEKIGRELRSNENIYFDNDERVNIKGLINLPAIEEVRRIYGNGLLAAIENFEFNPFHYVLLRLYSDRLVMKIEGKRPDKILPPLASIHQYHSQRIQAQKGVFLIVPHYIFDDDAKQMFQNGIDLRAMDFQPNCRDAMLKICIQNYGEFAEELKTAGEHRYSNYPDVEEYARSIDLNI